MSQDNEGFFKKFHETINNSLDDITRNNFANLESNSERVAYLCSLPIIENYNFMNDVLNSNTDGEFPTRKNFEKARTLKDDGNKAVQQGDWSRAMQLYSQSMIFMPDKESK